MEMEISVIIVSENRHVADRRNSFTVIQTTSGVISQTPTLRFHS